MSKNKSNRGPGRPAYEPVYPKHTPFSFREFCLAQGMEFKARSGQYIKGTGTCTPLTINKHLGKRGCPVVQIESMYAEPLSNKGLGRKAYMYQLRDGFTPEKTVAVTRVSVPVEAKDETATPAPAKRKYTRKAKTVKTVKATPVKAKRKYTRKATVTTGTSQTPTADTLDKIHAALAAPTPALPPETPAPAAVNVPVVDIPAPAPVAAPTPAPAAPAPVAQEPANAEIATPVAAA